MVKHTIEVVTTGAQTPYEGTVNDRLHVMHELAQRFKSNIRLWASYPVDDGNGCVDYEVEVIHELIYTPA